jgi:hypothetical protein
MPMTQPDTAMATEARSGENQQSIGSPNCRNPERLWKVAVAAYRSTEAQADWATVLVELAMPWLAVEMNDLSEQLLTGPDVDDVWQELVAQYLAQVARPNNDLDESGPEELVVRARAEAERWARRQHPIDEDQAW